MGTEFVDDISHYDKENENDVRHINEQSNLIEVENNQATSIVEWIGYIVDEVKIHVEDEDDGDRYNIMLNIDFAAHFLRLCKLLPFWRGVTCNSFGSTTVTSSSANVESYFKDVKHTLRDIIPASADVFVQNHMDGIDDSIITASQKYVKFIDMNIGEKTKGTSDLGELYNPVTYDWFRFRGFQ